MEQDRASLRVRIEKPIALPHPVDESIHRLEANYKTMWQYLETGLTLRKNLGDLKGSGTASVRGVSDDVTVS
jgi:hypothetical protein